MQHSSITKSLATISVIELFLPLLIFTLVNGDIHSTELFTHSATLRNGNITVYWKFNDTHITFEVHGKTTGWIGIGFSPNGAMTGADIFIGWVKNGVVKVTDRHGIANGFPPLDPQQDVHVLGGKECDGWTLFKFTRQLAACESQYDREITDSTQRLIWAWNDVDPTGDDVEPSYKHNGRRGVESMYFLEPPKRQFNFSAYKSFDLLMDKFEIPAQDTYYNCKLFKLPELAKKHHIIKHEPVIQKGNEVNVHHMLIYQCDSDFEDESLLDIGVECYQNNMPQITSCRQCISAWAIGGEGIVYPEQAGFSIGDEGDPKYMVIETHYDNPTSKKGIIDSSGMRFIYTDILREHDVGSASVGVWTVGTDFYIPPGADEFRSVGQCSPDCIGKRFNASGVEEVQVFAVGLHTHLAGRAMRLRHTRNGTELPTIAQDDNYDFNYQETRYLDPYISLKSTDHLLMECVYNTKDRNNVTEAGFATRQEMCLGFLAYFPKTKFQDCITGVRRQSTWPFFGIDPRSVKIIEDANPTKLNSWRLRNTSKTVLDRLNEFDWTSENIQAFEAYYNSRVHYEICSMPEGRTEFALIHITNITRPYEESKTTCLVPPGDIVQKLSSTECSRASDQKISLLLVAMLLTVHCNVSW